MMEKIRLILLSSRPISWINTAYPFGLAYLLNAGEIDWLFWLGIVFFLIPYNIAMYGINDVFDYESDMRNPRKGGCRGGRATEKFPQHTVMGLGYLNNSFPSYSFHIWHLDVVFMADTLSASSDCLFSTEIAF